MSKAKLMCIAGARPNFVKIAPILRALDQIQSSIDTIFIHTGQHYDSKLDLDFFKSLDIRQPDENLDVRSGSHASQTATIMQRFEPCLLQYRPDAILVVGDVNSTLACSLVAVKLGVPVIHVEAGLRSFDNMMPEEINRKLTDQISTCLFVTEESGEQNLQKEGISKDQIHMVGNVMIDSLMHCLPNTRNAEALLKENNATAVDFKHYGLVTLHRPSNVDKPELFENILQTLNIVADDIPLIFPMHPRTLAKVQEFRLEQYFNHENMITLRPLVYLDMLSLMRSAKIVLTDSGGIQEETSILKVPCLTLRKNTERPVTLSRGTNHLVGLDRDRIIETTQKVLSAKHAGQSDIPMWDGHAAERIVNIIKPWLLEKQQRKSQTQEALLA